MCSRIVIFDLDGVLVDTAVYHYKAWKRLAAELNFDFNETDNERLKGVSRMDSLEVLLSIGNVTLTDEEKSRYAVKKNEWYLEYIATVTPDEILPGVRSFLEQLSKNKVPIVLGSASKNAQIILEKTDLLRYFDVVIDGTHVAKAKPDPEVFTRGADAVGAIYKNAIVFEDSVAGIEAAHRAGMIAIGVGDANQLGHADAVIPNFINFTLLDFTKVVSVIEE